MDDLQRIPPQSCEAEMCVLGAILLEPACIAEAEAIVESVDFYTPAHGALFALISRMTAGAQPVDLVTVRDAASDAGVLDEIGGIDYLVALVDGVPNAANIEYYAQTVKGKSLLRQIITMGNSAARTAYEPCDDVAALLESLEAQLYAISHRGGDLELVTAGDAADAVLDEARKIAREEIPPGVMTGIDGIDRACAGMRPGELIVLAGDTGSGKTTLADTIACNVARVGGKVLVVSVEMLSKERAKRFLQIYSQVNGSRIRAAKSLDPADWTALQVAAGELHKLPILIHPGEATSAQVVSQARRASRRLGGLDLVVVDYLQLLTATKEQGRTRAEQVSRISWSMKMQLASDLQVPVILVSQLSRSGFKENRPPNKHDLKESGDVENNANAIWLLHRPDPEKYDRAWGEMWFCQDKHRDMPATPWTGDGAVRLTWHRNTTTFTDGQQYLC